MTENLNTNDLEKFEKISKEIKEIQSNSENDFNIFNKEILESLKNENVNTDLSEDKILELNRQLFNSNKAMKISELNNSLFSDFDEKFYAAYKTILSNLPGLGPFFSVVFSIFTSGPNLKQMFEDILKRVEVIVKKAVEAEARRNCVIIFQNLQNAGVNHLDLTTRWFDANGIKSHSFNGQEIKSNNSSILAPSPELEAMIRASYLDFKGKLEDAINYFSEPKLFGHTITFYIYTVGMYSSFLRDTIKWGKQMNFPPEIIDGTTNTLSLLKIHNNFIKSTPSKLNEGGLAYTKLANEAKEGYWFQPPGIPPNKPPPQYIEPTFESWIDPPGIGPGKLIPLSNVDDYPNGVTVVKPNPSKVYQLEPKKGFYLLSTADNNNSKLGYAISQYPSFRFGNNSLVPSFLVVAKIDFLIENKNQFNRNIAININHCIGREGTWNLNCYNTTPGESGSIQKSFNFTSYDVNINPQQINTNNAGMNRLGVFTINHKFITLTCVRQFKQGGNIGYSYDSHIYSIDIIDQ